MNRSRRSLGVLAVVCAFLQLAVASNVALGAGRANLALVFAAIAALTVGGGTGVAAGFLAGLFFDLCTTGPIGLMALLLTVASYLLGTEERNRMSDEPAASFVLFAVVSFVVTLCYHLAMLLMGERVSVVDAVLLRTLPTYALTLLAFLAVGFFIARDPNAAGPSASRASSLSLSSSRGRHARGRGLKLGGR